ncbi:MAG: TetR/AcrR family transcriptional regulator [Alphaproteobacteria bacterium]|nr:TetR/AcrR family transcriptional regulator [Alphaproteobacteria bacterium]MDE2110590.1 TetR/AcrR family transcriptional regulator [Alphaproteobacteria bacterium]MDE2492682.1 TetR/AcrR family transcriptional regulator [Alphaproteobacteria bacterium]
MDVRRPYHHGDLRNALLDAARAILEEESLAGLSLRAVARRAGVSHAAPYRHFPNHEALLVELAIEGFEELRAEIVAAAAAPGVESDRIANLGAAYMRFVARRPALTRLMFGPQLPNRNSFPALGEAADAIGAEIGKALDDSALGLAVWAAVHGLATLILENVIDLGQRRSGLDVLPSRAEILLRSLFSVKRE